MQYVSGQSLEQAGARLSLPQKVQVTRDVAEALHEAHRQGIVHRDIKPARAARAIVSSLGNRYVRPADSVRTRSLEGLEPRRLGIATLGWRTYMECVIPLYWHSLEVAPHIEGTLASEGVS